MLEHGGLKMAWKYILDGKTPVPCEDVIEWGKWFENADRHVAKDEIGEVMVSTVFLGLDNGSGIGAPVLFETMVFNGPLDQECERYSTWDEAEVGHKAMLERVKNMSSSAGANLPPEREARRGL
jgi:hypothetical protein